MGHPSASINHRCNKELIENFHIRRRLPLQIQMFSWNRNWLDDESTSEYDGSCDYADYSNYSETNLYVINTKKCKTSLVFFFSKEQLVFRKLGSIGEMDSLGTSYQTEKLLATCNVSKLIPISPPLDGARHWQVNTNKAQSWQSKLVKIVIKMMVTSERANTWNSSIGHLL